MARPSVMPKIKQDLEDYLDELEWNWLDQPESARRPTLPLTSESERKVSVRAIARAIGLSEAQEKYLYEREDLKTLINMMADEQGVLRIGARLEPADMALRERMAVTASQAKLDAQAAVESSAALNDALADLRDAHAEIQRLKLEIGSLKEQLNLARQGVFLGR